MTEPLHHLVDRLKHDRKLTIMAVLLVMALLLWGRLLLQSDTPRTASANRPTATAPASPAATAEQPPQVLRSDRPVVAVSLPDYLPRDLFNFPAAEVAWVASKNVEPRTNEEKSDRQPADEQLRSASVRQAAAVLQLRSVIMGETPSAVINGQVLRPGQQIEGFTLLAVSERHALLERNGVIVRLKM